MNKNKNGFTVIELLAVLIVLGIIIGITIVLVNGSSDKSKERAEEIFTGTLKDAVNIYLDSERFNLATGGVSWNSLCNVSVDGSSRSFSKLSRNKSFDDIIRSSYSPINEDALINPVNKEQCEVDDKNIAIFKDDLMNQYYYFTLDCLEYSTEVTNLPKELLIAGNCDINKIIPQVVTMLIDNNGRRYNCSDDSTSKDFYSEYQLCYDGADGNQTCLESFDENGLIPSDASNIRCRGRINASSPWVYSANKYK